MQQDINTFLQSVERRAYSMAYMATHNRDDALDIVQDSMFKLVEKYAKRPEVEWGPLFTRILQSKIRDWYRRNKVKRHIFSWFGNSGSESTEENAKDLVEQYPAPNQYNPNSAVESEQALENLHQAITELPLRQKQVFMLRSIEQLNVSETAKAIGISEGSVKTHYSRAVRCLQQKMQDHR